MCNGWVAGVSGVVGVAGVAGVVAIAAAVAPAALAAQGVSVGLTGGIGASTLSAAEPDGTLRPGLSWSAGLQAVIPLGTQFKLQPEIVYSRKGGIEELSYLDRTIHRRYDLEYIELPLLARWDPPLEWPVQPFLLAGPAPAATVRAMNTVNHRTENMADQVERYDVGLVFGVGSEMTTRLGRVQLNARYTLGLLDVDATGLSEPNRNHAFGIFAAYAPPMVW